MSYSIVYSGCWFTQEQNIFVLFIWQDMKMIYTCVKVIKEGNVLLVFQS